MYLLWKKDNTAQKNNSGALTAVRDTPCPHAFILSGKADRGASEQVGARDIIKTVIFTGAKGAMMCQVWGGHFKLTPQKPSLKGQKNPSDFEKKNSSSDTKTKKIPFFHFKGKHVEFRVGCFWVSKQKKLGGGFTYFLFSSRTLGKMNPF